MSVSVTTIDYSPLDEAVSSADIREFKAESRRLGQQWWPESAFRGGRAGLTVAAVLSVAFLSAALVLAVVLLRDLWSGGLPDTIPSGRVIMIMAGIILAYALYTGIRRVVPGRDVWATRLRQSWFAHANGLHFSPLSLNPTFPGCIFVLGTERRVQGHFYRNEGRFLDIGNYHYVIGSDESSSAFNWGFMALKLDRQLPNMVLDARSNNGMFGATNLPMTLSKDQRLSLEGDFDKYFTLYCPKEYERDALYIFTPDLMALLIDHTQQFDVEIVDDWMFVYSSKVLDLTDIPTLDRLFRIVDTVGAKTVSQTHRYADDRVGDRTLDVVAPPGKRLVQRLPLWAKLVLVAITLGFVYAIITNLVGFIRFTWDLIQVIAALFQLG